MKRVLCAAVVILLAFSFSSLGIAGGPKCPCFKAADLEKLIKKGWPVFSSQEVNDIYISFSTPDETWDMSKKGKGMYKSFQWFNWDTDYDSCSVYEGQTKWKGPGYTDNKGKSKERPMTIGGEESAECVQILEDVISSTSGTVGTISLEDTIE